METKKAIITKGGGREVVKINRRRACRYMCLECVAWEDIASCTGQMHDGSICPLKDFQNMQVKQNAAKRKQAIMAFCLDCVGGSVIDRSSCISPHCPLFPYRKSSVDHTALFALNVPDEAILEMTQNIEQGLRSFAQKRAAGG